MSTLSWVIFFLIVGTLVNFCLLMWAAIGVSRAFRLVHAELESQREYIERLEDNL